MDDELPGSRLKIDLIAAGCPVRSIVYDGRFHVTYWDTVTREHLETAAPIVAAAYARQDATKSSGGGA